MLKNTVTRLFIAILSSIWLVGCANDDLVYVDRRFSAVEVSQIQEAADFWQSASGGVAIVNLVFGARVSWGDSDRRQLVRLNRPYGLEGFDSPDIAGHTMNPGKSNERIGIAMGRLEDMDAVEFLPALVAHEFGHHFGLDHVSDPSALMNANQDVDTIRLIEAKCLRPNDFYELCRALDCSNVEPYVCAN